MRWLCRLITPPGGTIIDPFCGAGSTGVAAMLARFRFIGIEQQPDFHAIATARVQHAYEHPDVWFALWGEQQATCDVVESEEPRAVGIQHLNTEGAQDTEVLPIDPDLSRGQQHTRVNEQPAQRSLFADIMGNADERPRFKKTRNR